MKTIRLLAVVCAAAMVFCSCQKSSPAQESPARESSAASSGESKPESPVIAEEVTASDKSSEILVTSVTGTGQAQFQNGQDGDKMPLTAGQALAEFDIVTTGEGVTVVMALEEGKEVHIGENTVFALSAIRRDSNGNVNILALKQGSIVNAVDTALADGDVYEVYTPRLVMSVRGTSNYMSSGKSGDTVIGLTGETHVFSDGKPFNVVQGSTVDKQEGKAPSIGPASSSDLPDLASGFAGGRRLSFDGLSAEEIERAQLSAGDFPPSGLGAGASGEFLQSLFENPDITAPAPEDSTGQIPDDVLVQIQAPVNPPANPQPANNTESSIPESSSGSKASSGSSEKSALQSLLDAIKESPQRSSQSTSSRGSPPSAVAPTSSTPSENSSSSEGSSNSTPSESSSGSTSSEDSSSSTSSESSSSSTSSEDSSSSTSPEDHYGTVHIIYRSSYALGSFIGEQFIDITHRTNFITLDQLNVPNGYFVNFYGNGNKVVYGYYASISASSDKIYFDESGVVDVFLHPFINDPSIQVRFYNDTGFMGGNNDHYISTEYLSNLPNGDADRAIQRLIDKIWTHGGYIMEEPLTYDMVYAKQTIPEGIDIQYRVGYPQIWVKIVPSTGSAAYAATPGTTLQTAEE